MMGINIDNIEMLIKKNNFNQEEFANISSKLINNISELKSCYNGNSLDFLFNTVLNEKNNIKKISKVFDSYSNVLREVERGYKQQDINIKIKMNQNNSNV